MENIQNLQNEMQKLLSQITTILSISKYDEYDDLSKIEYNINNPDDLLLVNEYRSILYKLSDIQYQLKYLSKQVIFEGTLILRPDGRYGTPDGEVYYTSGSRIEFLINDEVEGKDGYFIEMPAWRTSTVEHNGTDYYIVGYKDINLNGLKIRVRKK